MKLVPFPVPGGTCDSATPLAVPQSLCLSEGAEDSYGPNCLAPLLDLPGSGDGLLGEEVGNGQLVGPRGVVEGDGHIDGDGLAAEDLDALGK